MPGDAVAVQCGEGADQLFQLRAGAAEDQGQIRGTAARKLQADAGIVQACGETRRPDPIEQVHRGHVQRQAQGAGRADRAVEGFVEVARTVVAETLRRIHQQAFGMDQAVVQGHAVQERLERGAGRAPGLNHVHVAEPLAVAERHRADVGARLQVAVVHHEQRRGGALGQLREIRADPILQGALQVGVEGGDDVRGARRLPAQAFGQQRGMHRRLQRARHHRLDARVIDLRTRPHLQFDHALEHLVARGARGLRMPVRTQPARRLRQHRQQRRFGLRQARGRFTQVGPARRIHALDGAAVGRALQVQLQDLALAQVRFQLQCAQQLLQLAQRRARADLVRHQDPRHLHGQGGTAGHDAARKQPLLAGAQQRPRIDPGVMPEPAVLVVQQRLQVQRRHALRRGRVAPHAVAVGKGAQRGAVGGDHQGGGIARFRQRQRERQVQQQQRGQQRRRAPAQQAPWQAAPGRARQQALPAPGAPRGKRGGGYVLWHAGSRWKRLFCLLRPHRRIRAAHTQRPCCPPGRCAVVLLVAANPIAMRGWGMAATTAWQPTEPSWNAVPAPLIHTDDQQ